MFTTNSNSTMEDLLNFIDKEDTDALVDNTNSNGQYFIHNADEANIFIKRYKDTLKQICNIEKTSEEALLKYSEKVNAWKESCLNPLKNKQQYYETLLQQYTSEQLKNSNKKSLKLIEGTIGFRNNPVKFNYDDEKSIINWLEQNNKSDYLKSTVSINKDMLKKAGNIEDMKFYIDNKEVPGISLSQKEKTFIIK